MKQFIIIILSLVLIALSAQVYLILKERNQLRNKFESLSGKTSGLEEENKKIRSEIEYYSNPDNLVKELRQKFNYKKVGEKLMIITP